MNRKTNKIVSEEKIFGNTFVIIRRKYVPENGNKNVFETYLKKENRL